MSLTVSDLVSLSVVSSLRQVIAQVMKNHFSRGMLCHMEETRTAKKVQRQRKTEKVMEASIFKSRIK